MSDIVRYYDKRKNPEGGTFPFQPLADITEADWKALEDWQQASIDAAGFWLKTKPRPAKNEAEKPVPPLILKEGDTLAPDDTTVPPPTDESEAVNG